MAIPDAQQILVNIANQVPQLIDLLHALAYIMGLGFIIGGVVKLKHVGEQRTMMSQGGLGGPLMSLMVGTLLIFLPTTIEMGTATFWTTPCSYCYPAEQDTPFDAFIRVCYVVINFVGLIAFIRGLVMLSHVGEQSQQSGLGRAMTHIIGGILCMNIAQFVETVFATLGI